MYLESYSVKKGDKVKGGQQIAVMGDSGHRIKDGKYVPAYKNKNTGQWEAWPVHLHLSYFPADLSSQEINPTWLGNNWLTKPKSALDTIQKNHQPTNTKCTNDFGNKPKGWKYTHEGMDFSSHRMLENW